MKLLLSPDPIFSGIGASMRGTLNFKDISSEGALGATFGYGPVLGAKVKWEKVE